MKISLSLSALVLAVATTEASYVPINVAFVSSPAINCLFDPSCTVTVTDSVGYISPYPGFPTNTPFFLQSRTYVGKPGSPAAGLYAYEYRIDLTAAGSFSTTYGTNCVFELSLDFGPDVPMNFDGSGTLADGYIVTEGGAGTVMPIAVIRNGSRLVFDFSTPLGTNDVIRAFMCPGESTFFMGFVSTQPPRAINAEINHDGADGFAFGGIPEVLVPARAPRTNPFILIQSIISLATRFPLESWVGTNRPVREAHRRLTLDLLEDAQKLVELGENDSAGDLLRILVRKSTGNDGSWVQCDPNSRIDQVTLLYDNLASAINVLQPNSPLPLVPPGPCRIPANPNGGTGTSDGGQN